MKPITKLSIIVFSLCIMVCGLWSTTYAAIPGKLSYQGKLTDSSGNPLNGTYKVVFRLYDASSGGNKLWEEIYDPALSGSRGVSINKGVFNESLGSLNNGNGTHKNLKDIPFTQQTWLSIQVASDAEMTQRQELASAAYAFQAQNANTIGYVGINGTPMANTLLPLDGNAKFPLTTIPSRCQVFTSPGTYTWTCPSDVTMVFISMCGGGGGGGGGHYSYYAANIGGSGGAGAEYVIRTPYPVTPGNNYTVIVGPGGAGGDKGTQDNNAPSGSNGTASSFNSVIYADGGNGGPGGNTQWNNPNPAAGGKCTYDGSGEIGRAHV